MMGPTGFCFKRTGAMFAAYEASGTAMPATKTLYDEDFVAWTEQQARALRAAGRSGSNEPLDWQNLAEEIEDLGKSNRRELRSQILRILRHLIKLQFSPALDPRRGWYESIVDARSEIELLLRDSPSLRRQISRMAADEIDSAIKLAIFELDKFGERDAGTTAALQSARYTPEQIMGDWFPREPPRE
jgi:hypothetical protein